MIFGFDPIERRRVRPVDRATAFACACACAVRFAGVVGCGPSVGTNDGGGGGSGATGTTSPSASSTGATSHGVTGETAASGTGTRDDDTTTGATAPSPCACVTPTEVEFPTCDDVTRFECDLEPICGHLGYTCPRINRDFYLCSIEYEYDEAALACALTALRDRTPGLLTAGGEAEPCGFEGCGTDFDMIAIAASETAMMQSCATEPLSGVVWAATRLARLAPPQYFQDCLDMPAAKSRYECLFDGLQERVPACGG